MLVCRWKWRRCKRCCCPWLPGERHPTPPHGRLCFDACGRAGLPLPPSANSSDARAEPGRDILESIDAAMLMPR
eukprot:5417396-Alexandrium_andersonii.AAC.1